MEPTVSMDSLYAEVVRLIFDQLCAEDGGQLAHMCSVWNAVTDAPNAWTVQAAPLELTDRARTELLACLQGCALLKLKLTCVDNTVVNLRRLIAALPETRSLDLTYCDNFRNDVLLVAFTGPQWTSLPALKLSHCLRITDVAMNLVTRWMPNLEHLWLNGCKCIIDASPGQIAANLSKPNTLEMKKSQLSNAGLKILAGMNDEGLP
ncbi:hypothetical protein HPB48_023594 [Haemaphysalis longicornis]|uniref:F-box domain-containing protein n=1 Tax=Haemaphysalis longicornis TaxID=44386 RepID=A0A9J6H8A4_HAELO|nr:hypothetical protein HPB48_023594 [Haemaphysalis longicornis]